jgi:hypothetical protein
MLEGEDSTPQSHPAAWWLGLRAKEVANIWATIEWAFKSDQNVNIGVALTIAAVPLWIQLAMVGEWKNAVLRALKALNRSRTNIL